MHMALMSSGEKYLVADLNLADFGRREIAMAEHEMPGLMELRARYSSEQPLSGVRITGSGTPATTAGIAVMRVTDGKLPLPRGEYKATF